MKLLWALLLWNLTKCNSNLIDPIGGYRRFMDFMNTTYESSTYFCHYRQPGGSLVLCICRRAFKFKGTVCVSSDAQSGVKFQIFLNVHVLSFS